MTSTRQDPDPATGERAPHEPDTDATWHELEVPTGEVVWDDPDVDATSTHALFDQDTGGLDPNARRALVVLLKNRFISAQSHPAEWRALVTHAAMVRSRLSDLFLGLRLDTEREVAFKYQVTTETGGRFPTLLHATEWTREETILLVRLRTLARAAHADGAERVFVDRQDLLDHVAAMRPEHATNQSRDHRAATRAVESLVSAGLLVGRKDADRFEVARAIDVLLPLATLQQLASWLGQDAIDPDAVDPDDLVAAVTDPDDAAPSPSPPPSPDPDPLPAPAGADRAEVTA